MTRSKQMLNSLPPRVTRYHLLKRQRTTQRILDNLSSVSNGGHCLLTPPESSRTLSSSSPPSRSSKLPEGSRTLYNMAGDPQRRLESLMSKLSQSTSPRQKNSLFSSDGIGRKKADSGLRVSRSSIGSVAQCRPWDRGDLMRRLATFKAMTWFGKPKAISPINCARRGWINVEMDVICCEACGARLLFATPSSWNLQQVEKAAAVFSLKLNSGHKLLCPWIDNACDEKLALFPPTPPPALVDSYNERSAMLLRLTALPIISSSAIDYMKSLRLEHFLSQSLNPSVTWNNGFRLTDNLRNPTGASEDTTTNLYYQAQKIISLCGWEPCLLPYIVDNEDKPSESSGEIFSEQRNSSIICTLNPYEVEGADSNHILLGENQYDPSSVVFDCRLCGARVGLWAFATVEHPLDYFTLITDAHGQNGPVTKSMDLVSNLEASKAESSSNQQNIGSTFKERPLGLNLTIASGPPPAKQNFRPVVYFPIISRHLRAEFASSCPRDHLSSELSCENHENSQFNQQKDVNGDLTVSLEDTRLLKRKRDENEYPVSESNDVSNPSLSRKEVQVLGNGGTGNIVNSKEIMHHAGGDSCRTNTNSECAEGDILQTERGITDHVEVSESVCMASNANLISRDSKADENEVQVLGDNFNSSESTSKLDSSDTGGTTKHNHGEPCDITSCPDTIVAEPTNNGIDNLENEKANNQTTISLETMLPTSNKKVKADHGLGINLVPSLYHKCNEFDPIRQHRPFCPWVAPEDGGSLPGWRLTLNALIQQEKVSSSDPVQIDSSSHLIDEDDPVISIRKLFMSPPTKRLKGSC